MSIDPNKIASAVRRMTKAGAYDMLGILLNMCPTDNIICNTCDATSLFHSIRPITCDDIMRWELPDEVLAKLCNGYLKLKQLELSGGLIKCMGPMHPLLSSIDISHVIYHRPEVFDIIMSQPESKAKIRQIRECFDDIICSILIWGCVDKLNQILDYVKGSIDEDSIRNALQSQFGAIAHVEMFKAVCVDREITPVSPHLLLNKYFNDISGKYRCDPSVDWQKSLFAYAFNYWKQEGLIPDEYETSLLDAMRHINVQI